MENFKIPTSDQVSDLFDATLIAKEVTLNEVQTAKFRHACYKVYIENQGNGFGDHIKAATI